MLSRVTIGVRLLDVAPLVDPVQILEILVKGAAAVDFVIRDVLNEDSLDVRRWQVVRPFLHDILPCEAVHLEKGMLLNLATIAVVARAKTLAWVTVQQSN